MQSRIKPSMILLWGIISLIAACSSEMPVTHEPPGLTNSVEVVAQTLAGGEFDLPAANGFGEPGFHEVLTATYSLPLDLPSTNNMRLVIALRDVGRPEQTCSRDHPLSGCATVDWSDAEGRPKVHSGGVFENSLTLQTVSGKRKFFLSESGKLADAPDAFIPG